MDYRDDTKWNPYAAPRSSIRPKEQVAIEEAKTAREALAKILDYLEIKQQALDEYIKKDRAPNGWIDVPHFTDWRNGLIEMKGIIDDTLKSESAGTKFRKELYALGETLGKAFFNKELSYNSGRVEIQKLIRSQILGDTSLITENYKIQDLQKEDLPLVASGLNDYLNRGRSLSGWASKIFGGKNNRHAAQRTSVSHHSPETIKAAMEALREKFHSMKEFFENTGSSNEHNLHAIADYQTAAQVVDIFLQKQRFTMPALREMGQALAKPDYKSTTGGSSFIQAIKSDVAEIKNSGHQAMGDVLDAYIKELNRKQNPRGCRTCGHSR